MTSFFLQLLIPSFLLRIPLLNQQPAHNQIDSFVWVTTYNLQAHINQATKEINYRSIKSNTEVSLYLKQDDDSQDTN